MVHDVLDTFGKKKKLRDNILITRTYSQNL